jgi:protein adenylyltransferase
MNSQIPPHKLDSINFDGASFKGLGGDGLRFDNRFLRELPADQETGNFRRQVKGACYSRVLPTPVSNPELIAYSKEVAELIGLDMIKCDQDKFAQVFSGNQLIEGMDPYAMCYGGHQFGNWAGQLGDGRAINLGEVVNEKNGHWCLQLKGAGPTPYSRSADGLAVLRSSVREFLCSEAMYHLGIPTTRALSLVLTGEEVLRDMFYDGNAKHELGAIVCRVSRSFTRFGSFQILAARNDEENLKKLVDYTINTDFSHLGKPSVDVYVNWLEEVSRTTAEMVLHWMRVGFVHGVMNTDNMSILGETIDYGPYGWLEGYDHHWTPNATDASGRRYSFGNQPKIALWNLAQFANALMPLVKETKPLEKALESYSRTFEKGWQKMLGQKLGLDQFQPETDDDLTGELLEVLHLTETDMTLFYRTLAQIKTDSEPAVNLSDEEILKPFMHVYYQPEKMTPDDHAKISGWIRKYINRVATDKRPDEIRREQMNQVNPIYVLRNYLAQQAIEKADAGDYSMITELLDVLRNPYDEQPGKEKFAEKRPEWARNKAGCSMLSCSS